MTRLMDLDEVCARLTIKKTLVYELIACGELPAPVKIGRSSRWTEKDVESYISGKIDARDSTPVTPRPSRPRRHREYKTDPDSKRQDLKRTETNHRHAKACAESMGM